MSRIAFVCCVLLAWSVQAQTSEPEVLTGELLDPVGYATGVNETLGEMLAREAARTDVDTPKGRNGAQGRWRVPTQRSDSYPHSGKHNAINEWGDTRMAIGFPQKVFLHGAYIAGQEGAGIWTKSLRAIGYRDGEAVTTTEWFTDIGQTPAWFEMNLESIDRVVFECTPVIQGGGWFGLDDLTYTLLPDRNSDEKPQRVVVDFEDADYRQVLTGTNYAGLDWEMGSGDFDESVGIPAPQTVELPPGPPVPDAQSGALRGATGTPPQLLFSFRGPNMSEAGNSFPPDTCGAVGPNHFVSIVNRNVSVYLKATGAKLASMSLNTFFSPYSTGGDPRILYDQYSGRWFAISTTFSGGRTIQLAASHTSDPTGTWFKTQFSVDQGSDTGCWPDYPTLGVNADGVYITTYMVGCGMTIFAIDKAPLIAVSPSLGAIKAFRGLTQTGAIQPVHSFGTVDGEYFIDAASSSQLRVRHLTGPIATSTLANLGAFFVPSYSSPPDAPAMGSTTPLDTVGARLMNAVYRDGRIWTTHAINIAGRSACRWYVVNPLGASPTLTDFGTVSDPVLYYFFPTIMVNGRGDAIMGFSGSHSGMYASTYFTGRSYLDPLGVMGPPTLYQLGLAAQNLLDQFGRNRFGDYSLCSLDPDNDREMWTIQEYTYSNNVWGTYIARLAYGDCNNNDITDQFDITGGTSLDCNDDVIPDECQLGGNDCNSNGVPDDCDIAGSTSEDCNANTVPDDCDIALLSSRDCNGNGIPDTCDLGSGFSPDCNVNAYPDECELAAGSAFDCNVNDIPDVCDTASGGSLDCNDDTVPDECQIVGNDCNANNRPDDCDEADLTATMVGPSLQTPCPDGVAVFSVSAPGGEAYQWFRDGAEMLTEGGPYSGTDTPTLTIDPAGDISDLSKFSCRVDYGCLQPFSKQALLNLAPTEIDVSLTSPSPITDCVEDEGGIVIFTVAVDDPIGAKYRWSRGGIDLTDDGHFTGTSTKQILINGLLPTDSGEYTCRVWNDCFAEADAITTTGVIELVDPVFEQQPRDMCVEFGGDAVFHGSATSPYFFVYRWYENGVLLSNGSKFSGTTTDTLTVHNVDAGDDGRQFYLRAIVVNPSCANVSDTATLSAKAIGECPPCPNSGGDMDNDGDFDLIDMQQFMVCFGVDVIAQPECTCANVDNGNDIVDLNDWTALEQMIGGPL